MILPVHEQLRTVSRDTLDTRFSLPAGRSAGDRHRDAASRALGDLALPVAFELARRLRKAPQAIARNSRPRSGRSPASRASTRANGYLNFFLDRPAFLTSRLLDRPRGARRIAAARSSSSTRRSTRTRRRTSAICATRRSATRSCGCCASRAGRSRCRTTSTTPACRSPTSSSASRTLERRDLAAVQALADDRATSRFDYYCWDLYARVTEWYEADKARLEHRAASAARDRGRRQRAGRDGRVHRRPHRPLPPGDDGAAERRLRPAHLGRRHPAPALLGDGLRAAEGARRRVPADRRPAEGLLGHADRRRRGADRPGGDDADATEPTRTTPNSARRSSSARTAP